MRLKGKWVKHTTFAGNRDTEFDYELAITGRKTSKFTQFMDSNGKRLLRAVGSGGYRVCTTWDTHGSGNFQSLELALPVANKNIADYLWRFWDKSTIEIEC